MRAVSVSEAKNSLSALLREVREGATILITDRNVAVARLVPPPATRGVTAKAIDLAQRGLLVLPERPPNLKWLELPWPKLKGNASIVAALLDERASGR
jgi:prevent-host-death family protein